MQTKRERIQVQISQLKQERASFMPHWQELNDFILPRRGRFLISDSNRGSKRHNNIIDPAATLAAGTLQSGMMSGITSPARPWFNLAVPDPELNQYAPVKEWLSDVSQLLRDILAKSNWYTALPV